jgi:hypothetical protein
MPEADYWIFAEVRDTNGSTNSTYSPGPLRVRHEVANHRPDVDITHPGNGTSVKGTVTVRGTAVDPDGDLDRVEIMISGVWHTAKGTSEWSYVWNTKKLDNGWYVLKARAYDRAGLYAEDWIRVEVRNTAEGGDDPPDIWISFPPDGATVSGTVNISGHASDDHGLDGVEVFVNGVWDRAIGLQNWYYLWPTDQLEEGTYLIGARATDTSGQVSSVWINVSLLNGGKNDPPLLEIRGPSVARAGSSILFAILVDDPDGLSDLADVEARVLDGKRRTVMVITIPASDWMDGLVDLKLDIPSDWLGRHVLNVTARDRAGNEFSSEVHFNVESRSEEERGRENTYVCAAASGLVIVALVAAAARRRQHRQ